jgi:hypothetical protein
MAFQASHRPQSVADFQAELRKALATPTPPKIVPRTKVPGRDAIVAATKTRAVPIAVAAVAVAIAGLGVWKLSSRETVPPANLPAVPPASEGSRLRDSIARAESLAGATQRRVRDSVARARADSANQARAALAIARRDSIRNAQRETARLQQEAARDSAAKAHVEPPPKAPVSDGRTTAATRAAAENRLQKEAESIAQSIQRGSVEGLDERIVRFVRSKKNLEAGAPTLSETKIADASASASVSIPLSWKSDFGATRRDALQVRIGLQLVGATWQRTAVTVVHVP